VFDGYRSTLPDCVLTRQLRALDNVDPAPEVLQGWLAEALVGHGRDRESQSHSELVAHLRMAEIVPRPWMGATGVFLPFLWVRICTCGICATSILACPRSPRGKR